MNVVLLEARRPAEQRALQDEMVRVWSQLEAMDAASAKRVLDAVTTMRQEMLDRITALPTVTIDQQETFAATSLRQLSAELEEIAGRFEQRYRSFLVGDMQDAARMSDIAHRAVLDALARATGVPPSLIVLSPLGLDATQIEAAILLNQSAIRNVSQAVVSSINREIQGVVFGAQSRWEAVRNIRDALSTTGGNLGTLTNRAMTIERTGLIQVFNIAAGHAYRQATEELPDLQVEWVTVQDRRVDPVCVALSGKRKEPRGTFPGNIIAPPAHPRCRCRIVAYLPQWGNPLRMQNR